MSRTSTVVLSLIGVVILIVAILGLIYGPGLYEEWKTFVKPIVEIAQSEERVAELNAEIPFEVPADGVVDEERLEVFFDIRRDLLPHYKKWQHMERELEKGSHQDWAAAKEILAAIQEVFAVQVATLQTRGMSPAEFVWIEDLAYVTWGEAVDESIGADAVIETLRETTTEDLDLLADLERRHGRSEASRRFAKHLEGRLDALEHPEVPIVEGVADATSALFWAHRDELQALDLKAYTELHDILRGSNNVKINLEGDED